MGEDNLGIESVKPQLPRLDELPDSVRAWIEADNTAARRRAHIAEVRAKLEEVTGSPDQKERQHRRELRDELRQHPRGSAEANAILKELRALAGTQESEQAEVPGKKSPRRGLSWPRRSSLPQVSNPPIQK